MLHQLPCPLWYLTDIRAGVLSMCFVKAHRGIQVGDFVCFECNDARFPKGVRRWEYVQVTALQLVRHNDPNPSDRPKVRMCFEVVSDLRDVVVG